jgi:hypothetical protein
MAANKQEFIAHLHNKSNVGSRTCTEPDCPVCHEPFDETTHHPVALACNHEICRDCVQEWSESGQPNANKCPLCRQLMWHKDPEYLPIRSPPFEALEDDSMTFFIPNSEESMENMAVMYDTLRGSNSTSVHRMTYSPPNQHAPDVDDSEYDPDGPADPDGTADSDGPVDSDETAESDRDVDPDGTFDPNSFIGLVRANDSYEFWFADRFLLDILNLARHVQTSNTTPTPPPSSLADSARDPQVDSMDAVAQSPTLLPNEGQSTTPSLFGPEDTREVQGAQRTEHDTSAVSRAQEEPTQSSSFSQNRVSSPRRPPSTDDINILTLSQLQLKDARRAMTSMNTEFTNGSPEPFARNLAKNLQAPATAGIDDETYAKVTEMMNRSVFPRSAFDCFPSVLRTSIARRPRRMQTSPPANRTNYQQRIREAWWVPLTTPEPQAIFSDSEATLVDGSENENEWDTEDGDDTENEQDTHKTEPAIDGTDMGDLEYGMHRIRRRRKTWPDEHMDSNIHVESRRGLGTRRADRDPDRRVSLTRKSLRFWKKQ